MNGRFAKVGFKPEALRLMIFDVDGTLYRQAPVRRAMALRLLSFSIGNPLAGLKTAAFLRHYRRAQEQLRGTATDRGQLETACQHSGVELRWGADCVRDWIERRPLDLVVRSIYPDLTSLLSRAAERGIKLAVVSDYPPQEKLRALGLERFFGCVLSPSDPRMGRLKPDPSGILAVLQELKIEASSAVYIGDRPEVDGEAARRAGHRLHHTRARFRDFRWRMADGARLPAPGRYARARRKGAIT